MREPWLLLVLTCVLAFSSSGQTNVTDSSSGFTFDPKIKTQVEKYISKNELSDTKGKSKNLIYNNRVFIDYYENDKLTISSKDSADMNLRFKSFYYWQHDTLVIDGAFGLFTGFGFSIKIHKDKAMLLHMLSSDEIPGYAYNKNDSLTYRLEVPCTGTKIILSEIPDSTKKQMIYGFVEFKSENYYSSEGSINDKEILPRKKARSNMKIYFRSISWPF
jgi:hypothetical protein